MCPGGLPFPSVVNDRSTGVGMEAIEGLRFLASLPLAGTGRTEGAEKTQPFNRFHSRLFITMNGDRIFCQRGN